MESPHDRAKRAINEKFDPEFESKYQKVKPALDRMKNKKDNKILEQDEIARRAEELKNQTTQEPESIPVTNVRSPERKSTLEIELDMFKPENIKARAENRINVIRNAPDFKEPIWSEKAEQVLHNTGIEKRFPEQNPNLDTIEKRGKNRLQFTTIPEQPIKNSLSATEKQNIKSRAENLKKFWHWLKSN